MLFAKALITGFTFAAMCISHVSTAPTAQPETSALTKRNSASDHMTQCYHAVQTHCNDIDNTISKHNNVIDVNVAAEVEVKLQAIVDLLVQLCADITVDIKVGVSAFDAHNCGNTFILMVNLLVTVLLRIYGSCQSSSISALAAVVLALKAQINLCSGLITGCINNLLGGILGLVLSLLGGLLVNITACLNIFVGTCGRFA